MLPTLESELRRRYKFYNVDDTLISAGHIIIGHTHAGKRVIDTFTRFVESGMLNEWEKVKKWVNLDLKSFDTTGGNQPMDVFRKKEMMMILVCISSLFAVSFAGYFAENVIHMISSGLLLVYFHRVCDCCKRVRCLLKCFQPDARPGGHK